MTKMSREDRCIFEQSIYLPIVLAVLDNDRKKANLSPFKIKQVYINLMEHTTQKVQKDLKTIHDKMHIHKLKLEKGENDGIYTEYHFFHKGYHEPHRYLNAHLRNTTEKMLMYYLTRNF